MDPLSPTLPPGDALAGLAAPRLDDRDRATRIAITIGAAVAPKLLHWEDAPPSQRARRLWAYTAIHLRRAEAAIRDPRGFAIEHDGTLATALDAIAHRAGVRVARELPPEAARPVRLALSSTTVLGALDAACAQAGCRGAQRARGELAVAAGAHPPYPTAYAGPARLRVVELRHVRATDFATTTASAQLRLRVDWEWPVLPLSTIELRVDGDPRGHDAGELDRGPDVGVVSEATLEVTPSPALALTGTLTATLNAGYDELRVPVPGVAELHGLRAEVDDAGGQLVLAPVAPGRPPGDAVSSVILAIADDGSEGIPHVNRVRTLGGGPERWGLRYRDGFGKVTELRLRIAAPPVRATLPFAVPSIALP